MADRRFIVFFSIRRINGAEALGNMSVSGTFPNQATIKKLITEEQSLVNSVDITNIMEVSKEDQEMWVR